MMSLTGAWFNLVIAIHKESDDNPIPEFELEIRRRVWCVLDTWDW